MLGLTRTQSLTPDMLKRTRTCQNKLNAYAKQLGRNVACCSRFLIPQFVRDNFLEPLPERAYDCDELMRITPLGYQVMIQQDLKAAWVCGVIAESIERCESCSVDKASIHGHFKGCGRSFGELVQAYGKMAHDRKLGLPSLGDEEMAVLLVGLAAVLDYTERDLVWKAKQLLPRVTSVNFLPSDFHDEVGGCILRIPVLAQARQETARRFFSTPKRRSRTLKDIIDFIRHARCSGCRPLFQVPQANDNMANLHDCTTDAEYLMERYGRMVVAAVDPITVDPRLWNELMFDSWPAPLQ